MTDAERKLWAALRGHRFQGSSFRRQAPIGAFIVDFVCQQRRLIIEVDGGQHATKTLHDIERETWLASKGYRILRFWNSDVLQNTNGVLEAILKALASVLPPSLTLLLKGGGDETAHDRFPAISSSAPLPNPPPQGGRGKNSERGGAER
jgi:very-short-patch-repair endonuclease